MTVLAKGKKREINESESLEIELVVRVNIPMREDTLPAEPIRDDLIRESVQ